MDAPPDSMTQITLIADARPMPAGRLPSGFVMRAPETGDTEQLGQLYFDSHVPGSDHKFAADAIQEVSSFFRGEFGDFWPVASGLIEHDGKVAAALLTVHRAPWEDTPDCPFITDLFTDQKFRRQGLARGLLSRCLNQAARTVRPNVALRADTGNTPAVRLYQAMGFRPYHPDR